MISYFAEIFWLAGQDIRWPLAISRRAATIGGTREPSSQKQFGLAESFCGFQILTKPNNKLFLKFLQNIVVLQRTYQCL